MKTALMHVWYSGWKLVQETIIVSKINSSKEDEQIYFGSDRFEQLCCTHDFPWVGPCPDHPTAKI